MVDARVVAGARQALGPVGALLGVTDAAPAVREQLDGVRRLEGAGYRALWTNEVIGGDAPVRASRPAPTAHAAAAQLHQAHPGRVVLGVGVGCARQAASVGRDVGPPVATARSHLQRLRELSGQLASPYPLVLAADGPEMLALAGELADGALPDPPVAVARLDLLAPALTSRGD